MACCIDTFVIFGAWQNIYCSKILRKQKPYGLQWQWGWVRQCLWLTTLGRVLVWAVLAVVISVTHPALRNAVTRVTLETTALTCVMTHFMRQNEEDRDVKDVDVTYFTAYFLHLCVNESLSPVQLASSDQSRQSLSPSQRHASRIHTPLAQVNSPAPHWWDSKKKTDTIWPLPPIYFNWTR